MEGISEDRPNETLGSGSENQELNDMQVLEKLFRKVQSQYKIDKVKLFNQLLNSNGNRAN